MHKVVDFFSALCLKGALVSSSVICSVARGAILANDRSLLLENGGHIHLNIDWSRQMLYRFDTTGRKMSCRRPTTAEIHIAPALLNETKFDFQRKIKQMQAWHEIPEALIINFDQTPLPYICTGSRTYAKKDPLTFLWLERERKNKSGKLSQLLYLDHSFPCSLSIKERAIVAFQKVSIFLLILMWHEQWVQSNLTLRENSVSVCWKKEKRTESFFVSKGNAHIWCL